MSFCSRCGNKLLDGVRFCSNCGSPVAQNNGMGVAPAAPRVNPGYNCVIRCVSDHPKSSVVVRIPGIVDQLMGAGGEMRLNLPFGQVLVEFITHRGHGFTVASPDGTYHYNLSIEPNFVRDVSVRIGRSTNRVDITAYSVY